MALDLLLQEARDLSETEINQVIRFVRFIKIDSAYKNTPGNDDMINSDSVIRKAGIYSGKGWMSEDFNDPFHTSN